MQTQAAASTNVLEETGFHFGAIGKSPSPPALLRRFNLSSILDKPSSGLSRSPTPHSEVMRLDLPLAPSSGRASALEPPKSGGSPDTNLEYPPVSSQTAENGEISGLDKLVDADSEAERPPQLQNDTELHSSLVVSKSNISFASDVHNAPDCSTLPSTQDRTVLGSHGPSPQQDVIMQDSPAHDHPGGAGDLYTCLSDLAQERTAWDELQTLHQRYREEHEELRRRHEETTRAAQREKEQAERTFSLLSATFDSVERLRGKQEDRWAGEKAKALRDIRLVVKRQDEVTPVPTQHPLSPLCGPPHEPLDKNVSHSFMPATVVPVPSQFQGSTVHSPSLAPLISSSSSAPQASTSAVSADQVVAKRLSSSEPPVPGINASNVGKQIAAPVLPVDSRAIEDQRRKEFEAKKRAVQEAKMKASLAQAQRIRDRRANEASKKLSNDSAALVPPVATPAAVHAPVSPPMMSTKPVVAAIPLQLSALSPDGRAPTPASHIPETILPALTTLHQKTVVAVAVAKPPSLHLGSVSEPGTVIPRKRLPDAADHQPVAAKRPSPPSSTTKTAGHRSAQQPMPSTQGERILPAEMPGFEVDAVAQHNGQTQSKNTADVPSQSPPITVKIPVKQEPVQEIHISSVGPAPAAVQPPAPVVSAPQYTPPLSVNARSRERQSIIRPTFNAEGDCSTRIVNVSHATDTAQTPSLSPKPGSVSGTSNHSASNSESQPSKSNPRFTQSLHSNYQDSSESIPRPLNYYPPPSTSDYAYHNDPMVNTAAFVPSPSSASPPRGRLHDVWRPPSPVMARQPARALRRNRPTSPPPRAPRNGKQRARLFSDRNSPSPEARGRLRLSDESLNDGRPLRRRRLTPVHSRNRSPLRADEPSPSSATWRRDQTNDERYYNDRYAQVHREPQYPAPGPASYDPRWRGTPSPLLPSPDWTAPPRADLVMPSRAVQITARVPAIYPPPSPEHEPILLGRLSGEHAAASVRNPSPVRAQAYNAYRRGQPKTVRGGRGGNKRGGTARADIAPRSLSQRLQKQSLADRFGSP